MEQKTATESRDVSEMATRDPELRQLVEEHRELDGKLGRFLQRPYLSPMEEAEVKSLKRQKLLRKDRIEAILARHR